MFRPITASRLLVAALLLAPAAASAQADLNDLEMAHVAVTASEIDIRYAHLALALSHDPEVRNFAETMIRDHSAVNQAVFDLAAKLGVTAQDNEMSRQLLAGAQETLGRLSRLRGREFDRMYASNELAYHETVNGVVADAFIPNIENGEVKAAFRQALEIFLGHEEHARRMSQSLMDDRP